MKRIKRVFLCAVATTLLLSSTLIASAALSTCPNGHVSDPIVYEKTEVGRVQTDYHVVQMGTTSVGCTVYTVTYSVRYKCPDCSAECGSTTQYAYNVHSVSH